MGNFTSNVNTVEHGSARRQEIESFVNIASRIRFVKFAKGEDLKLGKEIKKISIINTFIRCLNHFIECIIIT